MADEKNGFKKVFADKSSKKMIIFLGVVLFAIVGYVAFSGSPAEEQNESRVRSAPNQSGDQLSGDMSPQYEEEVRTADRQRIEQARNEGRSAIPSIIGGNVEEQEPVELEVEPEEPEIVRPQIESSQDKEIEPVSLPEPEAEPEQETESTVTVQVRPQNAPSGPVGPPRTTRNSQTTQTNQAQPEPRLVERPRPQTNEALRSAYAQQMSQIVSKMQGVPGSPQTQYFYQPTSDNASSGSGSNQDVAVSSMSDDTQTAISGGVGGGQSERQAVTTQQTSSQSTQQAASDEPPIELPLPGHILYATLISEANSDAPGPVVAEVLQGDLAGARLLGTFTTANDNLVIEFNTMTVEETMSGETIDQAFPINSVAVDAEHVGTAMATDVDRHLFSRVAVTFATSFIQGMGEAIRMSGQEVTQGDNGQTTTETPELSTKEQALIASGQAAGEVGNIVNEVYGGRPTTVKVASGTNLGVLFLQ